MKTITLCLALGLFVKLVVAAPDTGVDRTRPASETLAALQAIGSLVDEQKWAEAEAQALAYEQKAIPGSADDAYLKLTRSQILLGNNRFADAVEPLSSVVDSPSIKEDMRERAARGLGQVLYQLDRRSDALALFDRVFGKCEDLSQESLQFYAVVLLQEERSEDALKKCQLALTKKPELSQTLCQVSAAALQNLERFAESARYIELMLEADPKNASNWDQLVAAYYRAGNYWATIGAITRAQSHGFKQDSVSRMTKIELLYELERYEAAAELIKAWIQRDPASVEQRVWLMLAYCYDQQNRNGEAIAALERASKETPWPEMDLQLADRYWKNGDHAATYAAIVTAMKKGPVPKAGDAWTLAAAAALTLARAEDTRHALDNAKAAGAGEDRIGRLEQSLKRLVERQASEASVAAN